MGRGFNGESFVQNERLRQRLVANPGQWALVGEYDAPNHTPRSNWTRRPGYQARLHVIRVRGDRRWQLYARYVGVGR